MSVKPRKAIVIVCSSQGFDDCAHVHEVLTRLHGKNNITHVVHEGRFAAAFASAWTRVTPGVEEVVMPMLISRLKKSERKAKAATMLDLFKVRAVIAFGVDEYNYHLLELAQERGITVAPVKPKEKESVTKKRKSKK